MPEFPQEDCPFCDTPTKVIEEPMIEYCDSCKDYVFYDPSSASSANKVAMEM